GGGEHRSGRASEPALQPDPLGAEDVGQGITQRAKAVAHAAGEMLRGEWSDGSQRALVGPVVIDVEFADGFRLHGVEMTRGHQRFNKHLYLQNPTLSRKPKTKSGFRERMGHPAFS